MNAAKSLKQRACQTQLAADAANATASALVGVVLDKYPSMTSEASILQEDATLLQDTAQDFNRIALSYLQEKGGAE